MLAALAIGFVFGFVGSIPAAGPLALLIVSRALRQDTASGLRLAAGGALAESCYALIAFLGLEKLVERFSFMGPGSRLVGALLLLPMGIVMLIRYRPTNVETPEELGPPMSPLGVREAAHLGGLAGPSSSRTHNGNGSDRPSRPRASQVASEAGTVAFGFALVAVNPALLVAWTGFAATVATSSWLGVRGLYRAVPVAIGAFLGIFAWFATLLALVESYHQFVGPAVVRRVVRGMGVIFVCFALWLAIDYVRLTHG